MKEYKYRINGNLYTVKIGDIDNNLAKVEVNGVPYKVELQKTEKPVNIVTAPRPSAAPRTESGAKVINKPKVKAGGYTVEAPLPGVVISVNVKVGDTVKVKVIAIKEGKLSLSMKALNDVAAEEIREEKVVLPKTEELTTSLGDLFKNIKL